ncbi:MAG: ATP-binding protein [Methanospirillum sp.]|nr:ATP-binding protein [Methanospirillum sp.]
MNRKPVFRIGTDDFKELIDEGGYFVDKSLFIREIIEGNKVVLLPRPRRFGKTLNMTMLRYFFEKTENDQNYLFEGLAISDYPEYQKHQGQYPVIFISLKDVKGTSWFESRKRLVEKIGELLSQFKYIEPTLDPIYLDGFYSILSGNPDDASMKASLKNIITWLYNYHQKPVIVLIDEYDSPMIEAWTHDYYHEMTEFMQSWLGGGLKHENAHALYRAVITGILRIAKESIFSDLNNLKVISTLQSHKVSQMFGFTEHDINTILSDFSIPDHGNVIREWYNGYSFGDQVIYNPWSVTNYIDNLPDPPGSHWLNTSANTLVFEELGHGGIEIKRDLEKLLSGEEIRYPITETITFRDIGRNPANIWSFLYFSGYLRAGEPKFADYDPNLLTYALSIPNKEISVAYKQFVNSQFEKGDLSSGITSFLSVFLENKKAEILEQTLQNLTVSLVSFYDLARLPEAVFHAFVLGLLANLRSIYDIRSNAESGLGRADILMIPKTAGYPIGYVIEFKSIYPDDDMEKSAQEALTQIRERKYDASVLSGGTEPDNIRYLAIVLQGKNVMVKE